MQQKRHSPLHLKKCEELQHKPTGNTYSGGSDFAFAIRVYYATLVLMTTIEGSIGIVIEKLLYNGGIIYKAFSRYPFPSQTWETENGLLKDPVSSKQNEDYHLIL